MLGAERADQGLQGPARGEAGDEGDRRLVERRPRSVAVSVPVPAGRVIGRAPFELSWDADEDAVAASLRPAPVSAFSTPYLGLRSLNIPANCGLRLVARC